MDETQLVSSAKRFVEAWGRGGPGAEEELRRACSPDVVFRPDGVIWHHELKGIDAVLESLRREHSRHSHVAYDVVASAANPAGRCAFLAVAWEYRTPGDEGIDQGVEASRGLSLKELLFDNEGRVRVTRVARQMTEQEKLALLSDPSSCHPADLWGEVVPRMKRTVASQEGAAEAPFGQTSTAAATSGHGGDHIKQSEKLAAKMMRSLETWDGAWGTDGPDSSALPAVCSPNLKVLDGYGLHGSGSSYGLDDAQKIVSSLRQGSYSATTLLHAAVNPDQRVGFSRWEAKSVEVSDADRQQHLGGLDMALFDDQGRIEALVQFTMKEYPQLAMHRC